MNQPEQCTQSQLLQTMHIQRLAQSKKYQSQNKITANRAATSSQAKSAQNRFGGFTDKKAHILKIMA